MPLEIYLHIPQDGYELCHPVDEGGFDFVASTVDGTPRASSWHPLEVRLVRSLGEWSTRVLKPSDAPEFAPYTLVLRRHAAEVLRDVLGDSELLELRCKDAELVMLNPPAVPDAIDLERSSVDYFEGEVSLIEQHEFNPAAIQGHDVFKHDIHRASSVYFSDRFVEAWRSSGLVGLTFRRVWPDGASFSDLMYPLDP